MDARIYKILKQTKVEGPGTRYCIWFQGCSKHCKGCWAKETWDFNKGKILNADEILQDIYSQKNIEGVTFLGGEPFEQAEVLKYLSQKIKEKNLSIVCFTGLKIEQIKEKYPEILNHIDLLIDGEFIEEEKDYSRPWIGSKNQRYHFLTKRYDEKILKKYKNKVEINISKNGEIFINGMGDMKKISDKTNLKFHH